MRFGFNLPDLMIYDKSLFADLFFLLLFKILQLEFLRLLVALCQEWARKLFSEVPEIVERVFSPLLPSNICLHKDGEIVVIILHDEEIVGARDLVV